MAFTPDGTRLAAASGRKIHLWEVATGKELLQLQAEGHVSSIAVRPDGKMLAAGARGMDDNGNDIDVFQAWDVEGGKLRFTLRPR